MACNIPVGFLVLTVLPCNLIRAISGVCGVNSIPGNEICVISGGFWVLTLLSNNVMYNVGFCGVKLTAKQFDLSHIRGLCDVYHHVM